MYGCDFKCIWFPSILRLISDLAVASQRCLPIIVGESVNRNYGSGKKRLLLCDEMVATSDGTHTVTRNWRRKRARKPRSYVSPKLWHLDNPAGQSATVVQWRATSAAKSKDSWVRGELNIFNWLLFLLSPHFKFTSCLSLEIEIRPLTWYVTSLINQFCI